MFVLAVLLEEVQEQVAGCSVVQLLILKRLEEVLARVAELLDHRDEAFLDGDALFLLLLEVELSHELSFRTLAVGVCVIQLAWRGGQSKVFLCLIEVFNNLDVVFLVLDKSR